MNSRFIPGWNVIETKGTTQKKKEENNNNNKKKEKERICWQWIQEFMVIIEKAFNCDFKSFSTQQKKNLSAKHKYIIVMFQHQYLKTSYNHNLMTSRQKIR